MAVRQQKNCQCFQLRQEISELTPFANCSLSVSEQKKRMNIQEQRNHTIQEKFEKLSQMLDKPLSKEIKRMLKVQHQQQRTQLQENQRILKEMKARYEITGQMRKLQKRLENLLSK